MAQTKDKPNEQPEEKDIILPPKEYPKTWIAAVLQVMSEVRNIEKNANVGAGANGYKGVKDLDVKYALSGAMIRAGLVIYPKEINADLAITRWEETSKGFGVNAPDVVKQKASYFTEVKPKFIIEHISGESREIEGYGHGVDSQDKSAGKAMTYAQKYALLQSFMVATGTIDDADATHSDDIPTSEKTLPAKQPEVKTKDLPVLEKDSEDHKNAIEFVKTGGEVNKLLAKKQIPKVILDELLKIEKLPLFDKNNKEEWDKTVKFMENGGALTKLLTAKRINKEDQSELIKHFKPKDAAKN